MITEKEFLLRQPSYPEPSPTDGFYLDLANRLLDCWNKSDLLTPIHPSLRKRVCIGMMGYLQDVIVDSGLWHSFIDECRRRYGRTLPFFDDDPEYVDYELNRLDVRWLLWYFIAMQDETNRLLYPKNPEVERLADKFYELMEEAYEEAPTPKDFHIAHELEMHNPEDADEVLHLGNWLFLHSYLLTPAYALTLSEIVAGIPQEGKENDGADIQKMISQSMVEDPTGPLALYLREWLFLILNHRMPKPTRKADEDKVHPYYEKFIAATGGEVVKFFDSYSGLNAFLISALGWEKGVDHMPQVKNDSNFILYVDKHRGMLIARNVAQCFRHPENPMYDARIAREFAIRLLTVRGACPCDLVMHACKAGWLPDAVFPESADIALVQENHDFIARCYLQLYYRD